MNIDQKCSIIEEFMRNYSILPETYSHEDFINFKIYNDLGIPLAQAYEYGLIKLEADGIKIIEETWINFCNILDIDPDSDYQGLSDIIPEIDNEN